jgi:hypothetical protein
MQSSARSISFIIWKLIIKNCQVFDALICKSTQGTALFCKNAEGSFMPEHLMQIIAWVYIVQCNHLQEQQLQSAKDRLYNVIY